MPSKDMLFSLSSISIPINTNPKFENICAELQGLVLKYTTEFQSEDEGLTPETQSYWVEFDKWLQQETSPQESRIEKFSKIGKQLANITPNILNINVTESVFNIKVICKEVLDTLEIVRGVTGHIKNALSIFFTGIEFMRIAQDLYYYNQLESGEEDEHPFYHYAQRGTEYMNITWKDYGVRLLTLFKNLRTACSPVSIFALFNQKPLCQTEPIDRGNWKEAIATAEFAYCYNSNSYSHYAKIQAEHLASFPLANYQRGQFRLERDFNGAIVTIPSIERTIFLGLTGTKNGGFKSIFNHWVTNIVQYFGVADTTYFAAVGLALELSEKYPNEKIIVTGHSLGGGLTQFVLAALRKPQIVGIGFNSAGLSEGTMKLLKKQQSTDDGHQESSNANIQMTHVVIKNDIISRFGYHIGGIEVLNTTHKGLDAHRLITINKVLCVVNPVVLNAH